MSVLSTFSHEHPWMTYFLAAALIFWVGTFLVTLAQRGKSVAGKEAVS